MATTQESQLSITAQTKALKDAVSEAARIAPSRTPKPILMCVRLAPNGNGALIVEATDNDMTIQLEVAQVELEGEGALALPAHPLARILDRIDSPTVQIRQDGNDVKVAGQAGEFTVHTMPASDFPRFPDHPEEAKAISVEAPKLCSTLQRVTVARHRGEHTRYATSAILIGQSGNSKKKLDFVCTDGHRLALENLSVPHDGFSALIPARPIETLIRLAHDVEGEISMTAGKGRLLIDGDGWQIASALTEGNFPPYKDVIPNAKEAKTTIEVNRASLMEALRSAFVLTDQESRGVRFAIAEDQITLSSRGESGSAEIHVEVEMSGESMDIAFNPGYLIDALKVLDADSIELMLYAANKPGVLTSGTYLYLCMPVNLS